MAAALRRIVALAALLLAMRAAAAAELSAVAVFKDRFTPPECVDMSAIDESHATEISAVWMWSRDVAPVRREPAEARRETGLSKTGASILVRIEGEAGLRLTLRGAPAAMWEEVPEDLIPAADVRIGREGFSVVRIPADEKSASRLRLIGRDAGSWWVDVPAGVRAATIAAMSAADRAIVIRNEDAQSVARARLSLLDDGAERGDFRKLADYRSDASGRVLLRAVPDTAMTSLLFAASDYAPLVLERKPAQMPPSVTLLRGSRVVGRVVGEDGTPVRNAAVTVRTWVSDLLPVSLVRTATAATDGRWELRALPQGNAECQASAAGFADATRPLTIDGRSIDVGAITLTRGATAALVVIDDRGEPVNGAAILIGGRPAAETDNLGGARLLLPAKQPVQIEVTAPHHIATKSSVEAPAARPARIVLRRAFRLTGRFIDSAGSGIADARARLRQGSRFATHPIEPDGRFDLDLEPAAHYQVELFSPHSTVAKLDVPGGAPGETRDAGDVVATPGVTITGRLVRAVDGAPVPGARVWLPRPSESGPLMAWAFRDLIETSSAADGTFTLAGVPAAPFLLRIDAPALAGVRRTVIPDAGAARVDVGEIVLDRGGTVVVRLEEPASSDTVARIDTAGAGLSIDMLTASFSGGSARIVNVPAGKLVVSAWRKREMLCRREIDVPATRDEIEVLCGARRVAVSGTVSVGGRPAAAGTLVWIAPIASDLPTGIFTFGSGAAQQQHVFSPEEPRETADVRDGGRFEARIFPGRWDVLWMPDSGRAVGPRTIVVPDAASFSLALDYPGVGVDGIVLNASRKPVNEAQVRELGGRAFAITRDDGSFTLTGPDSGTWRLVARHAGDASTVAEVIVDEQHAHPFVELVLNASEGRVRVSVSGADGPARGAMVFVESDGGRLDLASADQHGIAEVRFVPPFPARLRAAASFGGRWVFGEWLPWDQAAAESVTLRVSNVGSVVVRSKDAAGPLSVTSSAGWRIDRLLQWLGAFLDLQPGGSVALSGLPPGTYTFAAGTRQKIVSVESETTAALDFD